MHAAHWGRAGAQGEGGLVSAMPLPRQIRDEPALTPSQKVRAGKLQETPVMTQGWILKKGTGKGMLQRSNWKWRWFVLESEPQLQLSYYTSQTCGKKKGGFLLRDVVPQHPTNTRAPRAHCHCH